MFILSSLDLSHLQSASHKCISSWWLSTSRRASAVKCSSTPSSSSCFRSALRTSGIRCGRDSDAATRPSDFLTRRCSPCLRGHVRAQDVCDASTRCHPTDGMSNQCFVAVALGIPSRLGTRTHANPTTAIVLQASSRIHSASGVRGGEVSSVVQLLCSMLSHTHVHGWSFRIPIP